MIRTKFVAALAVTAASEQVLLPPRTSRHMPTPRRQLCLCGLQLGRLLCRRPYRRVVDQPELDEYRQYHGVRRSFAGPGLPPAQRRRLRRRPDRLQLAGQQLRVRPRRHDLGHGQPRHRAQHRVRRARRRVQLAHQLDGDRDGPGRHRREEQSVLREGRLCRREQPHGGLRYGCAGVRLRLGYQWHNGWTVGAGWEYGITQNWIVGLEYDYATFETKGYQLAGTAPGSYKFDAKPRDIQSVVARVSYKFNGPLVARY